MPRQRAQPAQATRAHYDNPTLVALPDAVVIFDRQLCCCWANPAAETLLGSSLARLTGRNCTEVFGDGHWIGTLVERCDSANGQASARGSGSLDDGPKADRAAQSVNASVASLPAPDDATVLVLHETAASAALESTNHEKNRMAEMDRLVASIGHELNNPLSGIRGAAQLVKDRAAGDERIAGYCDIILRQVDRMGELSQILMELEAPVPKPRATNIHRVLNQVIELQEMALSGRQLTIERLFDPSLPDVLGDAEHLQVLFLNLVSNAVSACQPGAGHVTVKTAIDNSFYVANDSGKLHYVKVDVIDDGCGLDEQTQQNMFTPFYSGRKDGHGLGLAITRNIVAAHGGTIRADNRPTGGACFTVHLPVAVNSIDG
ncbi:MAG: ATP-binding protein [bacterium]